MSELANLRIWEDLVLGPTSAGGGNVAPARIACRRARKIGVSRSNCCLPHGRTALGLSPQCGTWPDAGSP